MSQNNILDLCQRLSSLRNNYRPSKKNENSVDNLNNNRPKRLELSLHEEDRRRKQIKLDHISCASKHSFDSAQQSLIASLYTNAAVELEFISTPRNEEAVPIKVNKLQRLIGQVREHLNDCPNFKTYKHYPGFSRHPNINRTCEERLKRKLQKIRLIKQQEKQSEMKEEISIPEFEIIDGSVKEEEDAASNPPHKQNPAVFKIIRRRR